MGACRSRWARDGGRKGERAGRGRGRCELAGARGEKEGGAVSSRVQEALSSVMAWRVCREATREETGKQWETSGEKERKAVGRYGARRPMGRTSSP